MKDFNDLRSSGLLWYLNRVALHPHGLALALHYDDVESGEATGWSIIKSDDGIWAYPHEMDQDGREKFTAFLKELEDEQD